jgi:hypothetical protein
MITLTITLILIINLFVPVFNNRDKTKNKPNKKEIHKIKINKLL